MFSELLLPAKHCSTYSTCNDSFNPENKQIKNSLHYYYLHFMAEVSETQRESVTCPKLVNVKAGIQAKESRSKLLYSDNDVLLSHFE